MEDQRREDRFRIRKMLEEQDAREKKRKSAADAFFISEGIRVIDTEWETATSKERLELFYHRNILEKKRKRLDGKASDGQGK